MHHFVVRRSAALLLLSRQAAAGQLSSTSSASRRWASSEAAEEADANQTETEGRKNKVKVEAAEALSLDANAETPASAPESQNGGSQSDNVYRRGLTPELRRQRRAELARRGATEDIALDDTAEIASTDTDTKPAQEEQSRPPRKQQNQQQQPSGKKPVRRRVDLRSGEGGRASYPGRRPNGDGDDATAIVERPGSSSRSGGLGVDRSHNRPVRSDRPGGEYVLGASRGAGSGGASPKGTGARPGQPGLNTQRDPLVGFAAPAERSSGQRYGGYGGGDRSTSRSGAGAGGSGNRNGGKKLGGGGGGGGPPRRRRLQRSTPAAAPMKPLPPPPSSVVNAQGRYIRARPLDAILESTPTSASIPARQFASLSADIKTANLDGDGASGKMSERLAGIARGDWKAFAAPVFKAQKHAASEKAGGAGSITQRSTKEELMHRARQAMVANGSVGLGGKVTVVQKIESAV